jgi:hypothetical protein
MTDDNVGVIPFLLIYIKSISFLLKLDDITHGLKSVQLEDEDASKYFINYISDDSDDIGDHNNNQHEHNQIDDNIDDIDISSLPNSVIITPVPQELFSDLQMKVR